MEYLERLHGADFVRTRRLLRPRRLFDGARSDVFRSLTLDHHSHRRMFGRDRCASHRLSDVPAAQPLFRAGDARLPPGRVQRVHVARLSGTYNSDEAGERGGLYAVLRSARLHNGRARHDDRHCALVAHDRALALRHVAHRDQAERGRRRSGRHQYASVEAPRHHAERRTRRGGRRVLRRGAAGGDAGIGVRHARVRAGPDGDYVRRGRHRLGPTDRLGHPHSHRRNSPSPAWRTLSRH